MHSYGTKILEINPSTSASIQENQIAAKQSFQQNFEHISDNSDNDLDNNYGNLIECKDENDDPIGLTEEESNVSSR